MASIFDSLKGLITPDLISQASKVLGEDSSNVTKAVTAAVPTLLGSILAKGNDSGLESVLKQAGSANTGILSNITNIFSGSSDEQTEGIGSSILNGILGSKLGGVTTLISAVSGISGQSSNKLFSMLGPLVGGFLGNKMNSDGGGLSGLLGSLNSEKGSFLSAIPSGLTSVLGISSLASLGSSLTSKAKDVSNDLANAAGDTAKKTKGGLNWLKWLIPLLLLLAVLFFAWKSCGSGASCNISGAATEVSDNVSDKASSVAGAVAQGVKSLTEFSLPNGIKINAYEGGIESGMISYLESDKYKKATAEELKDNWFNFDNIDFKFGSGTELTEGSHAQLDNVVAILKYHKDAKIKIGGYTDKKGSADVNLKLSQERANTIQKIFTEKGIGSQITGAEGYGDKFATVAVDASDEARAIDRKMSIRFDK